MVTRAQLTDPIGPIDQLTPEQRQAARRTVAAHAHDTADALALLAALGLED